MNKIDQVATAVSNGTSQQLIESLQTSRENALSEKLLPRPIIENLWLLMARLYGHKWTSQFGDQVDPGNVWAACLRGISSDQIKSGMGELVRLQHEWPPSAPEFRGMCTGESAVSWEQRNQAQSVHEALGYDPYKLPDMTAKERAREAARREIANMKSMFGAKA